MELPTRLNGFPVIKAEAHTNGDATVMVDRGAPGRNGFPDRYVVATWWPALGTTWHAGDYSDALAVADADFAARAKINGRHGKAS